MAEVLTYLEKLREIALDQHGFVTTAQAVNEWIPRTAMPTLASRNRIERVGHGIYRITQIPATPYENWALAVLWAGVPEACLSHETALAAWDVSDINPDRIHITVNRNRRIRRSGGERYVIHRQNSDPKERTWWQGIPITALRSTVADCIEWGTPSYLLRQAVVNGAASNLLTKKTLAHLISGLQNGSRPHP